MVAPSRQEADSECAQVWDFMPVVRQLLRVLRSPRAAAALAEAEHTSRAASLDCDAVSPLGSEVMPGSASFNPPKTA